MTHVILIIFYTWDHGCFLASIEFCDLKTPSSLKRLSLGFIELPTVRCDNSKKECNRKPINYLSTILNGKREKGSQRVRGMRRMRQRKNQDHRDAQRASREKWFIREMKDEECFEPMRLRLQFHSTPRYSSTFPSDIISYARHLMEQ